MIEILITIYVVGGAIAAFWLARVGLRERRIKTARELLEVIVLTWLIWPLILAEEIHFLFRDRERKRIERARRRRMMV